MDSELNHPAALKKKILFVITQSELGGAQHFLVELINGLPPEHFECSVVVGNDGDGALKSALPSKTKYIVATTLRRNPNMFSDFASLFELRKIYRTQNPDIIFLNSSKAGFNGSWAASALPNRLPNTTVIYRIGGWSFNDPQPRWKRILTISLEKISASWKDYIIVNSKKDFDDAVRFRISPKKELLLIHNGFDPYAPVLEPETALTKLLEQLTDRNAAPLQAKYLVATIANFYPAKGLTTLLEAVAKTKSDAGFIIMGEGRLRTELEKKIQDLNLSGKVYLAGNIPGAAKYLTAFSLFVLPSLKEGFPWSVLEAMAAKVPVIASRVGAVPEIIEQGKNGLIFPAGSSEQLAQAIDLMLSDENFRRQCAIEAHQTIVHHFSLRKMLDEYQKLLS